MRTTVSPELRMAHDIARQFADEPVDEVAEKVAAHIRKFWAPQMIADLVAEVPQASEVDPAVGAAVAALAR